MKIDQRRLAAGLMLSCALGALAQVASAQEAEVGELVVTGSRFARTSGEQPTPVAVVTSAFIANSGSTSLGDILALTPALQGSLTNRANADRGTNRGGLSLPDLRHLGQQRTLTLVNGQRHVAAFAGEAGVDLNTIPFALVDRVEISTGGASAVYGSDAVSGVINIVLKDDFEGIEVGGQRGGPLNGRYGQQTSAYVLAGSSFAGGRGNVTVNLFADRQDRVRGSDIEGLADWGPTVNPANTGPNDGVADLIYRPYVQADGFDEYGVITTTSLVPVIGFDAAGNPVRPPRRIANGVTALYGAFAAPCDTCVQFESLATPVPRQTRWGAQTLARYDLAEGVRLRGDVKYVETRTLDTFSPSFSVGSYVLQPDNAFLTPAIAASLAGQGSRFLVNRLNADIGGRNTEAERRTFRSVIGLEGEADAGFSDVAWSFNYNFGRTWADFATTNVTLPRAFAAAIDSTRNAQGQAVCRTDPGLLGRACTPFNLFGQRNSQAAIDYVSADVMRKQRLTQQVAAAQARFDTGRFLNLPGGAPQVAAGVEWRREDSRNINDPLVLSGVTEFAVQPNAMGGFEVREAFIETELPILRDAPLAKALTINAAARFADYSHADGASSYMVRGLWAPVGDVALRATWSRAVRAPNINEAFLPGSAGFQSIADPCTAANQAARPNRAANCRALGVGAVTQVTTSIGGTSVGNRNLKSETADTWTAGVVLTPRFLPGFSFSLDYYDIRIEDAISLLSGQEAANQCVDGPSPSSLYCSLISRDATTGRIAGYRSTYLNQAAVETAGYDLQASYVRDLAIGPLDGRLSAQINLNYLEKLRRFAFQDAPNVVDREEGELGDPRWSGLGQVSWAQGPVTLTWETRFMDEVRRDKDAPLERYDRPTVEAVWYHDLVARYAVDRGRGAEIYAGVNNIFAKTIPVGVTGTTEPIYAYDIFGRYMFAGVKARF